MANFFFDGPHMSQSAEFENTFCQALVDANTIYTIKDDKGIPTPNNSENIKTMPFWSSEQNAQAFIAKAQGYQGFEPLAVEWSVFVEKWATGLHKDGLCMGLDWVGDSAEGYDVEVAEFIATAKAHLEVPKAYLQD